MVKKNNNLHAKANQAIMKAVDSQLLETDLPEVKETYDRLVSLGYDDIETRKLIGAALADETFMILKHKEPFNRARYVATLRDLPSLPE